MRWLVVLAVLVGLWWAAGDRISDWLDGGRDSARGLVAPVQGLSRTLDQTRERVDETNRRIEEMSLATGRTGSAAFGSRARRELDALP